MKLHYMPQNSEEWFEIKLGKFSASTAAELLSCATTKGYQKLIKKITEEQFTGEPCESKKFQGNSFTERGHELESEAIENYEMENFTDVERIGFVELNNFVGCAPDRMIVINCLIQIKCPIFDTQRGYLKEQKVPANYYKQMQFELFVTGREYNIFYSYHPKLPPVQIKVLRDEPIIAEIKSRLDAAILFIKADIKYLTTLGE